MGLAPSICIFALLLEVVIYKAIEQICLHHYDASAKIRNYFYFQTIIHTFLRVKDKNDTSGSGHFVTITNYPDPGVMEK